MLTSMEAALAQLRRRVGSARRVRALTGAGVSAESGVPTFRGPGGLWREFRPEDLATPEAFRRDPRLVWEWYDWRRGLIARAEPNAAHAALAALERRCPDFWLITQNVDGLHQRAGSRRVLALHGDIWRARCTICARYFEERSVPLPELPPSCPECTGRLRPAVVWFGEPLPAGTFERAAEAARDAEVFLVVGTAGAVEPAASLARLARGAGAFVAEINPEPTALSAVASLSLRGPAAELLPKVIESRE